MTRYCWDASHYDWDRGPMNLAAARSAGISMMTHKCGEGYGTHEYHDPRFDDWSARARPVGFPVAGSYYVNHPGDQVAQAKLWVADVNAKAPWWRDHPCWVWQIDAEWFQNMPRQPNTSEINALGDEVVDRTGCHPSQVLIYAPEWLYGNTLAGLRYRQLWASAYGGNPVTGFKAAYPGDDSTRLWDPYSGVVPVIAQYGSRLQIGTQPGCDASGIRVTSDAALQALFTDTPEDDMTPDQEAKLDAVLSAVTARDADGAYRQIVDYRNDITHPNTVPGIKKTVSDTSASVLAAVAQLAAKVTDLQDAVAQLQPGAGGAVPLTVQLTGTATPSA